MFSLHDFATIAVRFDTAGDFITFLELRGDVMPREQFTVHDEDGNIKSIIPHVRDVLAQHMSPSSPTSWRKQLRHSRLGYVRCGGGEISSLFG